MPKKKHIISNILRWAGFLLAGLLVSASLIFIFYAKDLPRPEKFTEKQFFQSTKIYARTGLVILYEIYGEEKRTVVPLSSISKTLQQAVIATEDSNFYNHFGIDIKGLIRSVIADFKLGSPVYGGSTIDQQLIRSTFLSNQKTVSRKIREIILSLELDRRYSKDQIIEWYLNQVPFGQNAYGAEAAAQTYFKKPASDISLAQAALLAAIIQSPSYYSPYGSHLAGLLARKDYVLDRMVINNFITKEEAEAAKKEVLVFEKITQPIKAPHFTL
jgi:membrane peptidoglycan carboxypeptidase